MHEELKLRSEAKCELCSGSGDLLAFAVSGVGGLIGGDGDVTRQVALCSGCRAQLASGSSLDGKHWFCLKDSMWSQVPAVQVMAFRILSWLRAEPWASDLLDQLYLDDKTRAWAESGWQDRIVGDESSKTDPTKDSNGTELDDGDSVTLIKDLVVKGANFTAKRGTVVKNIALSDDPKFIIVRPHT